MGRARPVRSRGAASRCGSEGSRGSRSASTRSFLILVALVALAATEKEGPTLASSTSWLVALFACVVAHELGHSLVARRNGIETVEIELLPIGGISKLARDPEDPGVELRVAIAGPIVSVALGVVFALAAVAARVEMWPPTLYGGGFVARLAWVNLLLAAFNLLPALPLDGGRVLRAMLEQHTDRERATRLAARVARVVAIAMIARRLPAQRVDGPHRSLRVLRELRGGEGSAGPRAREGPTRERCDDPRPDLCPTR